MSRFDFDAIVVGSGFGGAVSACRLAEAGMKVLVLERGRRWSAATFPRTPGDPWFFDAQRPHKANGWIDLRRFARMWVAAAAGVGGGSLVYANVSVEAPPSSFAQGWPDGIDATSLAPYYARVGAMLQLQTVPASQATARYRLMQETAAACGWSERLRLLPLAVSFDPSWNPEAPGAREDHRSRRFTNAQGRQQGTCVHCGNCDIGCQVGAKNSLDFNYLAAAENHGAEIRPLHRVTGMQPLDHGWRVAFDRIEDGQQIPGSLSAARVVLAAGSIGSTELLLRCRDQLRTLPALSSRLGHGWAFNGDFVTPAWFPGRRVSPTQGVTISGAIDLLDGSFGGQALFIEDGGVPNVVYNMIRRYGQRASRWRLGFWKALGRIIDVEDPMETLMPWFGQGVDPGDGQLYTGRTWYAPWRRRIKLRWNWRRSAALVEAMIAAHQRLTQAAGGEACVPASWTLAHRLITPHPLGGCNMGATVADGVVDGAGRVFGYPNLWVMDGAAIPRALGLNPSRTIAALAERNCERLLGQA